MSAWTSRLDFRATRARWLGRSLRTINPESTASPLRARTSTTRRSERRAVLARELRGAVRRLGVREVHVRIRRGVLRMPVADLEVARGRCALVDELVSVGR